MKNRQKYLTFGLLAIDALLILVSIAQVVRPHLNFGNIAVLNPQGIIAAQERRLLVTATLLMLIGVIPVYIMAFLFAYKFRANNRAAKYAPDLQSRAVAGLIWAVPAAIILALAFVNWNSTHALDPYKAIVSDQKPITIQVVALRWKWLFIYPGQNIAAVNFVEFPENTPVSFELTSDAPMNSFWIPQLGGQMYAMAGMKTQLHLLATQAGEFAGSSAEISGAGFSGMKFIAKAASKADFDAWVEMVKSSPNALSLAGYNKLAEPSENNQRAFYSPVEKDLQNSVIMKFTTPPTEMKNIMGSSSPMNMQGMDMK